MSSLDRQLLDRYYKTFLRCLYPLCRKDRDHLIIMNQTFPRYLFNEFSMFWDGGSDSLLADFCRFYNPTIFTSGKSEELTFVIHLESIFPLLCADSVLDAWNKMKNVQLCETHNENLVVTFYDAGDSGICSLPPSECTIECPMHSELQEKEIVLYLAEICYTNFLSPIRNYFATLPKGEVDVPRHLFIYFPEEEDLISRFHFEKNGQIGFISYDEETNRSQLFQCQFYYSHKMAGYCKSRYFLAYCARPVLILKDEKSFKDFSNVLKDLLFNLDDVSFLNEVDDNLDAVNYASPCQHYSIPKFEEFCSSKGVYEYDNTHYIVVSFTNHKCAFSISLDNKILNLTNYQDIKKIFNSLKIFRNLSIPDLARCPNDEMIEIITLSLSLFSLDFVRNELLFVIEKYASDERNEAAVSFESDTRVGDMADKHLGETDMFELMKDNKMGFHEFYRGLKKLLVLLEWNVNKLPRRNGLTLLHAIIINNRAEFFPALFFLGCWEILLQEKVGDAENIDGKYVNKTAKELCLLGNKKILKEIDLYSVWEKSLNLIHVLVRKGDLTAVIELMKCSNEIVLENDSMNCSLLYWAVVSGDMKVVQYFLEFGSKLEALDSPKNWIFNVACWLGHNHLFELLTQTISVDLLSKDFSNKSPLTRILENGDIQSIETLCHLGKVSKSQLHSMLSPAALYGRINFIKWLNDIHNVPLQVKDEFGRSAFLHAAIKGNMEVLEFLLEQEVDVREQDKRNRNIFHLLCEGSEVNLKILYHKVVDIIGREETLKLLNSKDRYIGSELCMLIRGKNEGRDSWHYVEVIRSLMNSFTIETKRTGSVDILKYGDILKCGWGTEPNEGALLEIEKRFDARKKSGSREADQTPLHIATYKEKTEIIKFLLRLKVDVNSRDKFGSTPLHLAAMRGSIPICQLLIRYGALLEALDTFIKTPYDVALQNHNHKVAEYLKNGNVISAVKELKGKISNKLRLLSDQNYLNGLLSDGDNLASYVVDTLREMSVDINGCLAKIGRGPIQEASD